MKSVLRYISKNWKTTAIGAATILSAVPQVVPFVPLVNEIVDANPQTKMDWVQLGVKLVLGSALVASPDPKFGKKPTP